MRVHARQSGFTLIELVIVMVIIAILASIAIPSYRQHVIKVKRSEAKTALTGLSGRLQRCYTRFNAYNNAGCTIVLPELSRPDGAYEITGNIAAQSYTLTATPQGKQIDDTKCNQLTLDDKGLQNIVGGTSTVADCW